jgi:GDP-L-fucose synthase
MVEWARTRVLLTGSGGFLGGALRERIEGKQPAALLAPRASVLDLRDQAAIRAYLREHRPDLVIHAAGKVGGIGANEAHPGLFFHDNALMGIHLIEEARTAGVTKFVCVGTVCAYPKHTPTPFREADLWNGYPEETNAPYGLAKKMLLVQLQSYRKEYGFDGIFLLPANMYGPRDHFDPSMSHVIPAMIRKFITATENGDEEVVLWGDGTPTREFLFVEDAADAILLATEKYSSDEPMNLGTGQETPIAELATLISEEVGYRGRIRWDTSKPNGQPRRRLDVTRAEQALGFRAATPLREGLRRTIAWYRASTP